MRDETFDVLVLGAGAAGLMCAVEAGKRGRRVLVIDHARRPAEKIRISGGGRCNFTNMHTSAANFLSRNPRFCISALSRYTPGEFISLVEHHGITYHEKAHGQLFCNRSSQQIIDLLLDECRAAAVSIQLGIKFHGIRNEEGQFLVETGDTTYRTHSFVVASGGLSIPKMGATNLGYEIARRFGIEIVPTKPALVPLTFSPEDQERWAEMAGVSFPTTVSCGKQAFRESSLFTHRGLSGPAILQISSYWQPSSTLRINMAPNIDARLVLLKSKAERPQQELTTAVAELLPRRLAQAIVRESLKEACAVRLGAISDRKLEKLGEQINSWSWTPSGTEGYRIAEVTMGGIDTNELSSQTMECKKVPGLFFIGEVVDVTGHLGGFNFQWAWASGFAAGQAV